MLSKGKKVLLSKELHSAGIVVVLFVVVVLMVSIGTKSDKPLFENGDEFTGNSMAETETEDETEAPPPPPPEPKIKDISECDVMSGEDKDSCTVEFWREQAVFKRDPEVCDEIGPELRHRTYDLERMLCKNNVWLFKALDDLDIKKCDNIVGSNLDVTCRDSVLFFLAEKNQDPEHCDSITVPERKTECMSQFE